MDNYYQPHLTNTLLENSKWVGNLANPMQTRSQSPGSDLEVFH